MAFAKNDISIEFNVKVILFLPKDPLIECSHDTVFKCYRLEFCFKIILAQLVAFRMNNFLP